MVLNENMLVSKEDVSIDTRTLIPRDTYRSRISPYISMFKELIRKGNGTTEIKLRNIREFLGSDFKWKKEYTIYMMLKDILLEFGICTEVRHYYGFNVVMTFAGDNEKIIDSTDIARERRQKMAENAGFKEYRDYLKNTPSQKARRQTNMGNKDCKFYFVNIGKKFIAPILFPGAVINEYSFGGNKTIGGYDWTTSDGIKVKHIASTLKHRVDKPEVEGREGFERDLFQWGIGNNNRADVFILTAWDNRDTK
jgi:cell division protein FtsB